MCNFKSSCYIILSENAFICQSLICSWTDQQRAAAAKEGWGYRFMFSARLVLNPFHLWCYLVTLPSRG